MGFREQIAAMSPAARRRHAKRACQLAVQLGDEAGIPVDDRVRAIAAMPLPSAPPSTLSTQPTERKTMGVKINSLGLVISGQVRRVHDPQTDTTTIDLTREQCGEALEALGAVMRFFNEQDLPPHGDKTDPEPELPLGT